MSERNILLKVMALCLLAALNASPTWAHSYAPDGAIKPEPGISVPDNGKYSRLSQLTPKQKRELQEQGESPDGWSVHPH